MTALPSERSAHLIIRSVRRWFLQKVPARLITPMGDICSSKNKAQ
jgi:hypothetical protein